MAEEYEINIPVNVKYKSRLFELIFSRKEELLGLYNAANGTDYTDPELLEINTLENAIYMSMRNDVSFIIDSTLSLYEHQSIYNPNLPLRYLMYISDMYSGLTKDKNLYGRKAIRIPAPRFIIFYNGVEEQPDYQVMKLSDMFTVTEEHPALELEAIMLNINPGHNPELLDACRTLKDYSEYTARVRRYAQEQPLEEAVERAITECIKEGILAEFLSKYRAEAKSVSIYEYDAEAHIRMEKEDSYADGLEDGKSLGRSLGLKEGRSLGLEKGIRVLIEYCQELKCSYEYIVEKLCQKYQLDEDGAKEYMEKYWRKDLE